MRTKLLAMTAAIATLSAATAQTVATYDPVSATVGEHQPWSAMLPAPGTTTNVYPAPAMPAMPPSAPLPGGSTWDGINGVLWHCSGSMLASQATPRFAPKAPPTPPFPIAPGVLGPLGGYASGIAIDPLQNVMWLTGPTATVVGVAPIPGTPVVAPPFPLLFPTAMAPSGLEWDGTSGLLYTVDTMGTVQAFLPGGAPIGAPIPPTAALPPPFTGVCLDKSGQPNAAGMQAIFVTAGGLVGDVTLPQPMPFPIGAPTTIGLTYLGAPATNPPGPGVSCPTYPPGPVMTTTGPMTTGNATWAIRLGSLPPNRLVLFAFDFNFNPAWPMLNTIGEPVGFVLGSPTIASVLAFTDPFGNATYNMPLLVPALFGPIYNQNFAFCPADPQGFVVTPMQSIWASGF